MSKAKYTLAIVLMSSACVPTKIQIPTTTERRLAAYLEEEIKKATPVESPATPADEATARAEAAAASDCTDASQAHVECHNLIIEMDKKKEKKTITNADIVAINKSIKNIINISATQIPLPDSSSQYAIRLPVSTKLRETVSAFNRLQTTSVIQYDLFLHADYVNGEAFCKNVMNYAGATGRRNLSLGVASSLLSIALIGVSAPMLARTKNIEDAKNDKEMYDYNYSELGWGMGIAAGGALLVTGIYGILTSIPAYKASAAAGAVRSRLEIKKDEGSIVPLDSETALQRCTEIRRSWSEGQAEASEKASDIVVKVARPE